MTTLQVDIQDDLVVLLGMANIKKLIAEELAYQRFKLLESQIQSALKNSIEVDWQQAFEQARHEAYQIYLNRKTR